MQADPHALTAPPALHPRTDQAPLVVRAERALGQLAPFDDAPRLDGRFRLALDHLTLALRGLEGLRALAVAPEAVEPALAQMERLLGVLEPAAEQAARVLADERRPPARSRRRAPARPTPASSSDPADQLATPNPG